MTEEEKLALIKLTPEQNAVLETFIAAFDALEASGVRLFEHDYEFYAINVLNFVDFRASWEQLMPHEVEAGWIDEFPYWATSHTPLPHISEHLVDDDAVQGLVKVIDRNLFNN